MCRGDLALTLNLSVVCSGAQASQWDRWDLDPARHNAGIVLCTPPADPRLRGNQQGWSPLNNCSTDMRGKSVMIPTNSSGGIVHISIYKEKLRVEKR